MTEQEKQLLLKDLCMRLPYGTMVSVDNGKYREDMKLRPYHIAAFNNWDVKPYLRPLTSMSEDEEIEFCMTVFDTVLRITEKKHTCLVSFEQINWLDAHHFDYRGLIEKGLALEAPEGLYNF